MNPYSTAEDVEKFGLLYNWYAATEKKSVSRRVSHSDRSRYACAGAICRPEATDLELICQMFLKKPYGVADAGLATKIKSRLYGFGGSDDYGLALVPGGIYATSVKRRLGIYKKICVLCSRMRVRPILRRVHGVCFNTISPDQLAGATTRQRDNHYAVLKISIR